MENSQQIRDAIDVACLAWVAWMRSDSTLGPEYDPLFFAMERLCDLAGRRVELEDAKKAH